MKGRIQIKSGLYHDDHSLHFENDANGNVSGFQLDKYGSSQFVVKIK